MRSSGRAAASRAEAESGPEPVALEVPVLATGARPGDSAAKRSLFTEETQTVLVFEHGAVIRLSAAVADGQLLFLTNKKTGKEVVTQVIRKRSFRPTSCYVDLEFTEACPGFWGIEFPAADSSSADTNLREQAAEETSLSNSNPPPDQHEVERLKGEVAELQTRLKSLIAIGPNTSVPQREPSAVETATAAPLAEVAPNPELAKKQEEEKALEQLLAQAAAQETPHGPKRLVAYPKKSSVNAVAKKAGKVATVGTFAAVVVAAGFATYRFGILDPLIGKITTAKTAPGRTESIAAKPGAAQMPPVQAAPTTPDSAASHENASTPTGVNSLSMTEKPADIGETSSLAQPTFPDVAAEATRSRTRVSTKKKPAPIDSQRSGSHATAGLTGISPVPTIAAAGPPSVGTNNGATAGSGEYVAPKLVRAVKPVSPPEALRNYVTGNVNVDALVDATGHVRFVTIISGPTKLHSTAIDVMKQYVYEPARKNGKAVPSHVQASLQFWYEP